MKPSLRVARSCAMTVVHQGDIWVMGGKDAAGKLTRSVECYVKPGEWIAKPNLPEAIMLGSAISINGKLYVVGGMTGDVSKPVPMDKIYVCHGKGDNWELWTKMGSPRLNHATVSYGSYLAIVGGHTLVNNVPKPVEEAICFDVRAKVLKEYRTPALGSHKVGLGLAMLGDLNKIREMYGDR